MVLCCSFAGIRGLFRCIGCDALALARFLNNKSNLDLEIRTELIKTGRL
jgi:hypothetical protein